MKRIRSKTGKLPAKQRKKLVTEIKNEKCCDEIEEAMRELLNDQQLAYDPERRLFLEGFTTYPIMKVHFIVLLNVMKDTYLELLEIYCKGKKFLKLQNSWFLHVNLYLDETYHLEGIKAERASVLRDAWRTVVKKATDLNDKFIISEENQRIILVTMSSIFFDLMSVKMKDKKIDVQPDLDVPSKSTITTNAITETPKRARFDESRVSLYRFSGFALHSLLHSGRQKSKSEEELLKALKCNNEEIHEVPEQVRDLHGFTIITPKMIPYIQLLIRMIMDNISENQLKVQGHEMIKVAKENVLKHTTLTNVFSKCVQDVTSSCQLQLSDTCNFFKARKEIELESTKKVVDCDRSLRDMLKTFSSLKSRESDIL